MGESVVGDSWERTDIDWQFLLVFLPLTHPSIAPPLEILLHPLVGLFVSPQAEPKLRGLIMSPDQRELRTDGWHEPPNAAQAMSPWSWFHCHTRDSVYPSLELWERIHRYTAGRGSLQASFPLTGAWTTGNMGLCLTPSLYPLPLFLCHLLQHFALRRCSLKFSFLLSFIHF